MPISFAIVQDHHLDHVGDRAMLKLCCAAKRFLQIGLNPQSERRRFVEGHPGLRFMLQRYCTQQYCTAEQFPKVLNRNGVWSEVRKYSRKFMLWEFAGLPEIPRAQLTLRWPTQNQPVSFRIPRVYDFDAATFEIFAVSSGDGRTASARDGGDLTVGIHDRLA